MLKFLSLHPKHFKTGDVKLLKNSYYKLFHLLQLQSLQKYNSCVHISIKTDSSYLPLTMFSWKSSRTMSMMLETLTLLMRPLMLFFSASHAMRWYGTLQKNQITHFKILA